ncbi:MAG: hypothetical protein GX361_04245 [Bacteroidales bacterium]|nr:hypothetical protein [Bacteroidales bacterium]
MNNRDSFGTLCSRLGVEFGCIKTKVKLLFPIKTIIQRGLYHAISRFTTIDRFAEKYPWQSPYVHAGNNSVNYVDVNGDFPFAMKVVTHGRKMHNAAKVFLFGSTAIGVSTVSYNHYLSTEKANQARENLLNSLNTAANSIESATDATTQNASKGTYQREGKKEQDRREGRSQREDTNTPVSSDMLNK